MKKLILLVIPSLLFLAACGHPESYIHEMTDSEKAGSFSIEYVSKDGQNRQFSTDSSLISSPHFTDSVSLIIKSQRVTYEFPSITPKYFNMEGKIKITKNTYHDYFPEDWYPLRSRTDYLTYSFYNDDDHLFFIVFDRSSGREIANYFEYE